MDGENDAIENSGIIKIDTTGCQTTRPRVSKMVASLLIGVVVWTGENDTKTISVGTNLFETGQNSSVFV